MEVNEATQAASAHAHAARRAPVALSAAEALANTKLFPYRLGNPAASATETELVGDATADLLIVGGGFAGLWVTASADNIEAATILILSGGHLGCLPAHYAEPFEQRALVKTVGRTTFSLDVPLHLAMKRSASDKPIVDAFCEDLLRAFKIEAIALAA